MRKTVFSILAVLAISSGIFAQVVGTIGGVSGVMMNANGTPSGTSTNYGTHSLGVQAEVGGGDTVPANHYASIRICTAGSPETLMLEVGIGASAPFQTKAGPVALGEPNWTEGDYILKIAIIPVGNPPSSGTYTTVGTFTLS